MFDSESLMNLLDVFTTEEAKESEDNIKMAKEIVQQSSTQHQVRADAITESIGSDLDTKEVHNLISNIMEDLKDTPDAAEKLFVPRSIDDYDKEIYSDPQLYEIGRGIAHHIDVDLFDDPELSARQMHEIRLGLERGLDVSYYSNKYFREKQMREIRIGLQDNLDVEQYARLIYSPTDMRKKREKLFEEKYADKLDEKTYNYDDLETGAHIYVEPGLMEAGIVLSRALPENYTKSDLYALMSSYDITEGFVAAMLPTNLANLPLNVKIPIMRGTKPCDGIDGYYEYKYPIENMDKPVVLDDGRVDYSAAKQYIMVSRGDVVAIYHGASAGKPGKSVTGVSIPGRIGNQLEKLVCDDIILSSDQVTYLSKKAGYICFQGNVIKITDYLTFDKDITMYDGKISYDGSIIINGSVLDNSQINATGDIYVSGYVEPSILVAGGNLVVSGGLNGDDRGTYISKGNMTVGFVENATVEVGGDFEAGYVLNSNVTCDGVLTTNGRKSLLCGGVIEAKKGIVAGTIGSKAGAKTELICGAEYDDWEERSELDALLKKNEEESNKIRSVMDMMLQKLGSTAARQNDQFVQLQSTLNSKKSEKEEIQKAIDELAQKRKALDEICISVGQDIYINTYLSINGCKLRINENARNVTYISEGRTIGTR